jgi:hypothetical protein
MIHAMDIDKKNYIDNEYHACMEDLFKFWNCIVYFHFNRMILKKYIKFLIIIFLGVQLKDILDKV